MIQAHETFDGTWPYTPHFFAGAGFRMHYVDEAGDGPETFVCVHGEADRAILTDFAVGCFRASSCRK